MFVVKERLILILILLIQGQFERTAKEAQGLAAKTEIKSVGAYFSWSPNFNLNLFEKVDVAMADKHLAFIIIISESTVF